MAMEQRGRSPVRLRRQAGLCARVLLDKITMNWADFLNVPMDEKAGETLRHHDNKGRPLGDESFIRRLEEEVGRMFRIQKPGPKPSELD